MSVETGPRLSRRQISAEGTRCALLDSARECFATVGYDATSVATLTSHAGVSKGGFYRHFPDKKAVFEAVFSERLLVAAAGIEAANDQLRDSPQGAGLSVAARATSEFVGLSLSDPVHRALLRQAPQALGPDRYQQIDDQYVLPPLIALLTCMAQRGELISTMPVVTAAQLLLRVLCSGNTLICQAHDPRVMFGEVLTVLGIFCQGMVTPGLSAPGPVTSP
jgi:AcrR family transcriptional regulator